MEPGAGDQPTPLSLLAQQPGGGRGCAETVLWVQRETTIRPPSNCAGLGSNLGLPGEGRQGRGG